MSPIVLDLFLKDLTRCRFSFSFVACLVDFVKRTHGFTLDLSWWMGPFDLRQVAPLPLENVDQRSEDGAHYLWTQVFNHFFVCYFKIYHIHYLTWFHGCPRVCCCQWHWSYSPARNHFLCQVWQFITKSPMEKVNLNMII